MNKYVRTLVALLPLLFVYILIYFLRAQLAGSNLARLAPYLVGLGFLALLVHRWSFVLAVASFVGFLLSALAGVASLWPGVLSGTHRGLYVVTIIAILVGALGVGWELFGSRSKRALDSPPMRASRYDYRRSDIWATLDRGVDPTLDSGLQEGDASRRPGDQS